jgi:hypothetical protein
MRREVMTNDSVNAVKQQLFDAVEPPRVVRYTRTSSESAHAKSQEQQLAAIDKSLKELGMHLFHIGDYSD